VQSSMILAVLLMIGGIEQNPVPAMEVEINVRLLCAGCDRNMNCVNDGIIRVVEG
jgi:hypothetical protein